MIYREIFKSFKKALDRCFELQKQYGLHNANVKVNDVRNKKGQVVGYSVNGYINL